MRDHRCRRILSRTLAFAAHPAPGVAERTPTVPARAHRPWLSSLGALALVVPVLALAAADGGYFAESWGWATLAYLWLVALALITRAHVRLGRLDLALLGSVSALAMLTLVSVVWSSSPSQTPLEAQRALLYVAAIGGVLLLTRPSSVCTLLGGLTAGITIVCAWGLVDRLFPDGTPVSDAVGATRLAEPLGYWNALGLFSAMGSLLAYGVALQARTAFGRGAAAAAMVVLLPTLYFTFGRAAWLALLLGAGGALLLVSARRRLVTALVVLGSPPVAAVLLSSRLDALSASSPSADAAAEQGRFLAAALLGLALIAALAAAVILPRAHVKAASVRLPHTRLAAVLGVVGVVVAGAVVLGNPVRVVDRGYESFDKRPSPVRGDLRARLLTLSGSGRVDAWRVAWNDYRENPLLGSGAGSFEQYWLEHRPTSVNFRDAHSLYLETLAELGPLGLAFLGGAVAAVVVAALRVRRNPLAACGFGAVVCYLAHAGVDWDWEMPAVTIAALICGASLVVLSRGEEGSEAGWRLRAGGVGLTVALGAAAVVGLVGNGALATSITDLGAGDYRSAEREALRASRWAPWSAEPWYMLGEARLAMGEPLRARRAFRMATERDPRNWVVWAELARVSEGRDQRQALARAFVLNPRAGIPNGRRDDGEGQ